MWSELGEGGVELGEGGVKRDRAGGITRWCKWQRGARGGPGEVGAMGQPFGPRYGHAGPLSGLWTWTRAQHGKGRWHVVMWSCAL